MAGTSTKVQATKTKGNQDLSESDESVDDLRTLLFPDHVGVYTGPGAYSARELQEELGLATHERARHLPAVEPSMFRLEWGRESEQRDARNQRG